MKSLIGVVIAAVLVLSGCNASAQEILFEDDFSSNTLDNWYTSRSNDRDLLCYVDAFLGQMHFIRKANTADVDTVNWFRLTMADADLYYLDPPEYRVSCDFNFSGISPEVMMGWFSIRFGNYRMYLYSNHYKSHFYEGDPDVAPTERLDVKYGEPLVGRHTLVYEKTLVSSKVWLDGELLHDQPYIFYRFPYGFRLAFVGVFEETLVLDRNAVMSIDNVRLEEITASVPTEEATWGSVKALYR